MPDTQLDLPLWGDQDANPHLISPRAIWARLTQDLIPALREDRRVEFKSVRNIDFEDIAEYYSAFSNTPDGGVLVFGVENDGTISGCVCGPAGSVQEALQLADNEPPDIAFVDINLEDHAEGLDVARILYERHGTTCIFLTAQPQRALPAGSVALGVIAKPYDPAGIATVVEYAAAIRAGAQLPTTPRGLLLLQ